MTATSHSSAGGPGVAGTGVAGPGVAGPGVAGLAGMRILLVDHDPAIRVMFGDALRDLGHEVMVAESAARADAILAGGVLVGGARPGVMVVDGGLGAGRDGLDLVARVRAAWPDLPVLVTGAVPVSEGGMCLAKPFLLPALLAAIRRCVAAGGGAA